MFKSITTKRTICSLTAILALSLTTLDATAGMSVMAANGRPYNNTPQSSFSINDGKVYFDNGCSVMWITPIPVPYSTNVVYYSVYGNRNSSLIAADACTFNASGTWTGCYSIPGGSVPVSVPIPDHGGTLFVRAYNSGCTSGAFFSGAYITN